MNYLQSLLRDWRAASASSLFIIALSPIIVGATGSSDACADHLLVNQKVGKTLQAFNSRHGGGVKQIRWELDDGEIFDSRGLDYGTDDTSNTFIDFFRSPGTKITICRFKSKMDGGMHYSLRPPGNWPGKSATDDSLVVELEK